MLSVMACAEEGAASSYTSDPMGLGLDTESDAGTLTPSRLSLAGAADFPASASPHSSAAGLDTPQDARGQGVALVVDAEVTSYLMMGALSPGLKRHSVTLFEGEQAVHLSSQACNCPPIHFSPSCMHTSAEITFLAHGVHPAPWPQGPLCHLVGGSAAIHLVSCCCPPPSPPFSPSFYYAQISSGSCLPDEGRPVLGLRRHSVTLFKGGQPFISSVIAAPPPPPSCFSALVHA